MKNANCEESIKCFVCRENCKYGDICDQCRIEFLDQHYCKDHLNKVGHCNICDEPITENARQKRILKNPNSL